MHAQDIKVFRADDNGHGIFRALDDLYRYRELLLTWTIRDIKVRYKQSLLGVSWAIVQPLSLMIIYTVVFSFFIRVPSDGVPYPIFAYTALLPWTFFASAITFGVPSIVNNLNLVTKIYFPREIFPLAALGACFVDLLIAAVLLIPLLIYYGVPLTWAWLWIPLLLSVQIIFTIGVVLIAAALNVFYRDVRFVLPLLTQLWLYATPVIYPQSIVPEQFRGLYLLNPMAGLIEGYREVLLHGQTPNLQSLVAASLISIALFVVAYLYFERVEPTFADVI